MAEQFGSLTPKHIEFIERQPVFFVGTAGAEGKINVSPKGLDTLRVLGPKRVVWLNLTGSGNETAAHVRENRRMTLMFCSFGKQPLILRLYGRADMVYGDREERFASHALLFSEQPGARQFFEFDIDLVLTSCGYGVPRFNEAGERKTLGKWAANKGEEGIRQYWRDKNRQSLDGKDTGIPGERLARR